MYFILGCLLLGGFYYAPLWFVAAIIAAYLFFTSPAFRHGPVEAKLIRMVEQHQNYAQFPDLGFDRAKRFAVDKGSKRADQQTAFVAILLRDDGYAVSFTRVPGGGTAILLEKLSDLRRQFQYARAQRR